MKNLMMVLVLSFVSGVVHAADSKQTLYDRSVRAADALRVNEAQPDHTIPKSLLEHATCIATFPNVLRAGFIFGAKFGQGIVSCRINGGWSSPSYMTIAGGSWGLQIGVDSTDLILVFVSPDAIRKMTQDKLELGAGASIAAGPVGRDATVGSDITLNSEIYSYSLSKGLYGGLTLQGSVIAVNTNANTLVYGTPTAPQTILQANLANSPKAVWPYVNALMNAAP
jgi:lipid-binding SYLF domain-containing protein